MAGLNQWHSMTVTFEMENGNLRTESGTERGKNRDGETRSQATVKTETGQAAKTSRKAKLAA